MRSVADFPDQKLLWDNYGHAMGAAHGLELAMRIAIWDYFIRKYLDDRNTCNAEVAKLAKMTIGGTYKAFLNAYPNFADDAAFTREMGHAIDFRNHLAHHFLEGRLDGLRSERGIRLIILECKIGTEQFRSLQNYVRSHCAADFQGFLDSGKERSAEWDAKHPLAETLDRIERGEAVDLGNIQLPSA
jgi:hypothetical protein